MLKFIGSGSAFNTKLGNTSAYYKIGNQMLLIDCGSNIFHRIKEHNLLEGIEDIHVLITHTHADHVGSLADFIFYSYFCHGEMAKSNVCVYSVDDVKIEELLAINGIIPGVQCLIKKCQADTQYTLHFCKVLFEKSSHVKEIPSYSIELSIDDKLIYYTGDTNSLKSSLLNPMAYDYVYVDTCKADYEGNVHLSLRKLSELVRPDVRSKYWCMHLDEGFDRQEAETLGFNVVANEL
ncbi:MBL fold metallo-hydrolase [Lysinibacillus sp. CNPSo 3705]|uniref:MBL fold metallo-hydrolase n=1 Tax=Lysinibacillus sp. CNPSo 3705 TaxID=3028148 RepID=UPI00104D2565|nr:MBL fold metallo-hydrolase [Lysinibacillus sp. CNPSo 3705]MDD1502464.1 MBL fold metallo-hydrolase [Lysinibacillus sp. CNPSo 3705]